MMAFPETYEEEMASKPGQLSRCKLPGNRRVLYARYDDEDWLFQFKRLVPKEAPDFAPTASHIIRGGRVAITTIRLSNEAFQAMVQAYIRENAKP